ncbi:MAG: hypothetical protein HYV07_30270 [Deltaproteobacteria bacterium]|nr:hypothetical protein [Deltaproteobacteria bacterium]
MRLRSFETGWLAELLAAMIPSIEGESRPSLPEVLDEIAADGFFEQLGERAPFLFGLGLRLAIWTLFWAPVAFGGRLRSFRALEPGEKNRVLEAANEHPAYVVRQLVIIIKLVACFAYFTSSKARRAFDGARA